MKVASEARGLSITAGGDPRITKLGRFIRKTKLDEFPQLWNVLVGDMSFVGPRPEVPKYVALYSAEQREVLALRPGITDLASIEFRNEEALLSAVDDPESFYIEHCVPAKIRLNLRHARNATLLDDIVVILKTVFPFLHKSTFNPSEIDEKRE